MEQAYLDILKKIGEDPDRPGLADTPKRAAKARVF
jgi:GTP cyclohydrolase I